MLGRWLPGSTLKISTFHCFGTLYREQRKESMKRDMVQMPPNQAQKEYLRARWRRNETNYLWEVRERRQKVDVNVFVEIKTIGHWWLISHPTWFFDLLGWLGAFGVVSLVKEMSSNYLFAINQASGIGNNHLLGHSGWYDAQRPRRPCPGWVCDVLKNSPLWSIPHEGQSDSQTLLQLPGPWPSISGGYQDMFSQGCRRDLISTSFPYLSGAWLNTWAVVTFSICWWKEMSLKKILPDSILLRLFTIVKDTLHDFWLIFWRWFCSHHRYIHRDIKPDASPFLSLTTIWTWCWPTYNFLFDPEGHIKLSELGLESVTLFLLSQKNNLTFNFHILDQHRSPWGSRSFLYLNLVCLKRKHTKCSWSDYEQQRLHMLHKHGIYLKDSNGIADGRRGGAGWYLHMAREK